MKLLNILFVFSLSIFLMACAPEPLNEYAYHDWLHSLSTPKATDMKYDGNTVVTKERTMEQIDPSVIYVAKTQGDYMEVMVRQFRQDLLSTGGQVKQDGTKVYIYMPTQSVFGSNQVTVKPSIEPTLKAIAKNLKNHPETMIRIIGHTDNSLSVLESKALSLRQANAFANYLKVEGVSSRRLLAEGYGSLEPFTSNATPAGRARNCYIEMIIYNLQ